MIPVCEPVLLGNEKQYVMECLDTVWISSRGKYIALFEKKFSEYCGVSHGVACSSGTAGLHMAMEILGIGQDDEIIIPNLTIIVSANVVIMSGAKPVLVDVDPVTWGLDPAKIEERITDKTKAIMLVHMYGHPCDMDPINAIAKKYGLFVIEDCCQSHGAHYKGKMTGALSDISVFSFYGNKTITCGEGGMLLTDNEELAEKARLFRDNGFQEPRFIHTIRGMNYRLTNMQAAVGLAQTEKLGWAVARKRELANKYMELLEDFEYVTLPVERPWAKNAYWMFAILINPGFGLSKTEVMQKLKERGVDSRSFFYPISQQPAVQGNDPRFPDIQGHWPVSDDLAARGLYLPSGLGLTDDQIAYCVDTLKALRG